MKLNLPETITVNIPTTQGTTIQRQLLELPITIIDSESAKRIQVFFPPLKSGMTLWAGTEYSSFGNYTQEQIVSRIFALLGDDWKTALINLNPATTILNNI